MVKCVPWESEQVSKRVNVSGANLEWRVAMLSISVMISVANVTGQLSRSGRVLAQDSPARSCRLAPQKLPLAPEPAPLPAPAPAPAPAP